MANTVDVHNTSYFRMFIYSKMLGPNRKICVRCNTTRVQDNKKKNAKNLVLLYSFYNHAYILGGIIIKYNPLWDISFEITDRRLKYSIWYTFLLYVLFLYINSYDIHRLILFLLQYVTLNDWTCFIGWLNL